MNWRHIRREKKIKQHQDRMQNFYLKKSVFKHSPYCRADLQRVLMKYTADFVKPLLQSLFTGMRVSVWVALGQPVRELEPSPSWAQLGPLLPPAFQPHLHPVGREGVLPGDLRSPCHCRIGTDPKISQGLGCAFNMISCLVPEIN